MSAPTSSLSSQSDEATIRFLDDVVSGLSADQRSLPAKYFYDEKGSALFDQICELDEYYPTRAETRIMEESAGSIADRLGHSIRLVEYGSGSSVKTRLLLDHLSNPLLYAPVDISGDHLLRTARELEVEYPSVEICPVIADFTEWFEIPDGGVEESRTCTYFPGSTIGNFSQEEASALLEMIADRASIGDGLLIGFDLVKDVDVLESAYNDSRGVTAEFNKNLLRRINHELQGDFQVDDFEHHAFYDHSSDRIEMHLVSRCDQQVTIDEHTFSFQEGESICTEHSHKYTIGGFARMSEQVGWKCRDVWTDPQGYFAVMYLDR